jgi:hypothetical protein
MHRRNVGNRSEPYRWLLRVHNNLSATAAAAKPTGAKDGEGIPTLQVDLGSLGGCLRKAFATYAPLHGPTGLFSGEVECVPLTQYFQTSASGKA